MKLSLWSAPVRHLTLLLLSVVLGWTGTDLVPILRETPGYGALAAGVVATLLAVLTPLVQSYGVGAAPRPGMGSSL